MGSRANLLICSFYNHRKDCESVAKFMTGCKIRAKPYHAGLDDELRARTQKEWLDGHFKLVCATIAFGMGIDKSDVRYVFHYSAPKSIEGYYQEAGECSLDGHHFKTPN